MNITEMDRTAFVQRFGGVYEHSEWVAEEAWDGGFLTRVTTAEGLAEQLARVVAGASKDRLLALLRAHPDLAGRLALAGKLTASSTHEQASAGLDHCTLEELARFRELNDRYVARFGFPFILAVRGCQRAEILAIFKRRTEQEPEVEFQEALAQVHRIAALRISDAFPTAGTVSI